MDTSKLITIAIWATIGVVVYEALRVFYASQAGPFGLQTSGNAGVDQLLIQQRLDLAAREAAIANQDPNPQNPYASLAGTAAPDILQNLATNVGGEFGWNF